MWVRPIPGWIEKEACFTRTGATSQEHRSQGITVDTSHTTVGHTTNRPNLYVATTRGRTENYLYVPVEPGVTQDAEGMHLESINNPALT